jgi:hypothetical protein
VRRVIRYQEDVDAFVESDLVIPRRPGVGLIIAHSSDSHEDLSARLDRFGVPHANTAATARIADDKWACWQRWSRAGVATPPTALLPASLEAWQASEALPQAVAELGEAPHGWFIQPRHGTEGRGVVRVNHGADASASLLQAFAEIAPADDAIIRPRIGLLGAIADDCIVAWDLRINVCRAADVYRATSAYVLVAPGPDEALTSVSAGGRIESCEWLVGRNLCLMDSPGTVAVPWSTDLLHQAASVAEKALAALPPLVIAGVDLKLDRGPDGATFSVIDVNPRPAGLLHANLLGTGEPGIGASLWRELDTMARADTRL